LERYAHRVGATLPEPPTPIGDRGALGNARYDHLGAVTDALMTAMGSAYAVKDRALLGVGQALCDLSSFYVPNGQLGPRELDRLAELVALAELDPRSYGGLAERVKARAPSEEVERAAVDFAKSVEAALKAEAPTDRATR